MFELLKKNKNFKNLWLGRLFSNAGDSMYYVVLSWYLISITQDPFWIGIINFSIFIPNIFSFLVGNFIDKHNKKTILIFLEIGQLLFLMILIIMLFFKMDNPYFISLLAFFISVFGMNTYTVQDALIPFLVQEEELAEANQYMSIAYNTSDYFFNALSGFIIKILSTVSILFIDMLTFVLSIFLFNKINYEEVHINKINTDDFWKGFKLIFEDRTLLYLTFLSGYFNVFFGGLGIYQVVISKNIGDSMYYGILLGIISLGVVIGNSYGASYMLKKISLGKSLIYINISSGLPLCILFLITNKYLILILFFIFGIFLGINHVLTPTYYQKVIEHQNLGRFYSASYSLTVSTFPLGALLFGYIARYMSYNYFFLLFGLSYVIFGIYMLKLKKFREIL